MGWSNRRGLLGDFERGRKFCWSGRLDGFWRRGGRRRLDGLLSGCGRSGGCKAIFKFVDAVFQFLQVFEAGFELVEGFDDAGETLVVLLAMDAGLHPAIESPDGKDEDPELHGTSGRGLQAMLRIGRVYRELLAASGILERAFPGEK
jgi:hypothetical protein